MGGDARNSSDIALDLYIDECGDQNLEAFSPTFPVFTLCGILVRDDKVPLLNEQVRALKKGFWGDRQSLFLNALSSTLTINIKTEAAG